MLCELALAPKDVTTLSRRLRRASSRISQDLTRLRRLGLVRLERNGRHHIYYLTGRIGAAVDGSNVSLSLIASDGSKVTVIVPAPKRIR